MSSTDYKPPQPQPGGYTPYGFNSGANAYTPNFPAGGYPPPNPNAPPLHPNAPPYQQPQPGGYTPYPNTVSYSTILNQHFFTA